MPVSAVYHRRGQRQRHLGSGSAYASGSGSGWAAGAGSAAAVATGSALTYCKLVEILD